MAVTDYKYPGTAANVDRDSKAAWSNPNSAKVDDTNYANCVVGKNSYGDWLLLTNFGFSSADIPEGATINGIEFVVSRRTSGTDVGADSAIYLYDNGAVGSNMASAAKWPVSIGEATYGGATNMCGTSITQADIVVNTFGIQISFKSLPGVDTTGFVDYIKIRVYYTECSAGSLPLKNVFGRPFSGVFR